MGFWIFMLICDLLVPAVMILAGWMMAHHPPKNINSLLGYRTARSMKNQDTWNFAHAYCGKLWWKVGWIALVPSVVVQFLLLGKGEQTVGIVGGILVTVQTVVLLVTILPVERALKRTFDENGKRK